MIRYIEYVYLLLAVVLGGFLALRYKELTTFQVIALATGTVIAAFVYSFRRSQRRLLEQAEAENPEDEEAKGDD